ncbi:DUF2612 domain-containing protein [Alcaligenes sp. SDU_A2]|uniref:DUF2612 domain-containing protein n=1 Tax=Alcaligenes sp. SDU_A2 TaxID=3136634 RepID=UPI002C0FE649|nr:DUF2612 domain-containing protein [Alcaligenes sp.]HRL28626.1 DUF2612 domain-containing protein [Alcaligenes sp.]
MDLEQDHADIAWGHFLAQYGKSARLESVVRALYAPVQHGQLQALYDERWLDTALGRQLDGIGEIVGQPREIDDTLFVQFFGFQGQASVAGFGKARLRRHYEPSVAGSSRLPDAEYRKILYWKIGLNNGHGTAPEIAASVKAIFDASIVRVRDLGNARLGVWFNTTPQTNPALMVHPERWVPALAGVGVELLANTDQKPFGFVSQGFYGFGVGVLARQL